MSRSSPSSVLLVEGDVLVRLALADYLRKCGFIVVEAADGIEAKQVLQKGPMIDHLLADVQLTGKESGFELAQWTRRYRPKVSVILTGSLASKADAVAHLCSDGDTQEHASELLAQNIRNMRGRGSRGAAIRSRTLRRSV